VIALSIDGGRRRLRFSFRLRRREWREDPTSMQVNVCGWFCPPLVPVGTARSGSRTPAERVAVLIALGTWITAAESRVGAPQRGWLAARRLEWHQFARGRLGVATDP